MKVFRIFLGLCLLIGLSMQVFAEGAMRWNKNLLLIYMPANNEYTPLMSKAINEWESKFSRKIHFIQTTNPKDVRIAEIQVIINQVSGADAKNSGETSLSGQVNTFRHAVITINTLYNEAIESDVKKKEANDNEIYRVMQHEVGKLMGLSVSTNPQSVMNKEIIEGQTILQEDIDNIYNLYGWGVGRRVK